METLARLNAGLTRELEELLDTACFSFETVRMAIAIGGGHVQRRQTLDQRLASSYPEDIEAGTVAIEALDHAREAYLELSHCFDQEALAAVGYDTRFWSSFDWCWKTLFTDQVRTMEPNILHKHVMTAIRHTSSVAMRIKARSGNVKPMVH
jgi:hypothetical protein